MSNRWWQGGRHNADAPEPLAFTEKTPQDLFDWAELHFNYEPEKVKEILKGHGKTVFYASNWWMYVILIRTAWENDEARKEYPEVCPICSQAIERDKRNDGRFGVKFGWKCTANRFHFMTARVNELRTRLYANNIRDTIEQGADKRPTDDSDMLTPKPDGLDAVPA